MISSIQGTITEIRDQLLIIDIGQLGLSVAVPTTMNFKVGSQVKLTAHMHWNAEQGPSLFGFTDPLEKTIFLLLISCSGVGPKLALAALGYLGSQGFLETMRTENVAGLSKVPGIGAKRAEQIIVHLKHKVNALLAEHPIAANSNNSLAIWQEVAQALESLNYSRPEINQTMHHLSTAYTGTNLPFDQLLRHALSFLARK